MKVKLDWSDLTVLLAFDRTGTIADAASELSIDESTAARRLNRLEAALGMSLVTRAAGKVMLTSAGKRAIEHARVMEDAASNLVLDEAAAGQRLTGDVRLTGLMYILTNVIIPSLPNFYALHPGVRIQLQAENKNLSLIDGETDIAVRLARPKDATTASTKLGELAFAAYRPKNRFRGVPHKRCPWIGPDEGYANIPEWTWLKDNIHPDRIVMQSNSNICNVAVVKSGMACAVLPVLLGDNDRDMIRMDVGVLLHRELWLMHRHEIEPSGRIAVTLDWLKQLFADTAPQFGG